MPSEFARHLAARLVKIKPDQRARQVRPFLQELRGALEGMTGELNAELERRGVAGSASVEGDDGTHDFRVRLAIHDRIAFVDVCAQAEGRLFSLAGALTTDARVPAEGLAQPLGKGTLLTAPELAQKIMYALAVKCITG